MTIPSVPTKGRTLDYAAPVYDLLEPLCLLNKQAVYDQTLIQTLAPQPGDTILDLGCGTGLCGELLRPLVDAIDGIDLSAAMLEQARGRGIYRHLERHELNAYLAARTTPADLFVAADVFGYIGDLAPAFAAVRRLLRAGGCFAFTVEQLLDGGDYTLQPCLRYRHSEDYVRRLAAQHGFTVRELAADTLRHDQQTPIPALYVYLA